MLFSGDTPGRGGLVLESSAGDALQFETVERPLRKGAVQVIETPVVRRQANAMLKEPPIVVASDVDNLSEVTLSRMTAERKLVETGALGEGIRSGPANIHVSRWACS